ncbi:MAG: carbohydrate ABC transporter permease [Clostridiaceae bacterium]|nr:carbohydrate ABC transporter permease [Clostridiaceae bacterium]
MTNSIRRTGKKFDKAQPILILFCLVSCFITIYPMYYVLIMSISDPAQAAKGAVYFWPKGLYFGSYEMILHDGKLWRAYGNTVFYAAASTLLMLFSTVIMAYPLTRPNLRYRKAVIFFLLVPMYFGGGLIPSFLLVYKLGMYNTIWAMILPSVSIWNIILARTFFMSIPNSVAESAFMDGANHFQVLRSIYLPLSKPVLAVISIYTIVGVWNSWFNAMVYLPNENLHPLQMYLQRILISQTVDLRKIMSMEEMRDAVKKMLSSQQLKYTMILFISAPIIMVYPLFQKHFIKGIMLGSLKG